MRIAYFVQLNTALGAGVNKKISSQIIQWLDLGHSVKLFVATKNAALINDFIISHSRFEVEIVVFGESKFPPPIDGRIKALSTLITSVICWEPAIVYMRQDLYLPPLGRLLKALPVVIEVNTDDLAELQSSQPIFRWLYRNTRHLLLARAAGHVFVSSQIRNRTHYTFPSIPSIVLGNGVDLARIQPIESNRQTNSLIFIGSPHQIWHGVDKIARLAKKMPEWTFNIIGPVQEDLNMQVPKNLIMYGHLDSQKYESLMEDAVVAFGTLALHRKGMDEASPLKVREYLGYGLPVVLGYKDTDLSATEDYILSLPNIELNVEQSFELIADFVKRWSGRRVARARIKHLDYAEKEKKRIAFFFDIIHFNKTKR